MSIPGVIYGLNSAGNQWEARGRSPLPFYEDRSALVRGTYFPTPGVSVGLLTDTSGFEVLGTGGSTTLTSVYDGDVIENKIITDNLILNCRNVTFRNCLIIGAPTFIRDKIIVSMFDYNSNNVFEDCEIAPQFNDYRQHIIQGHNFTMRRTHLHHGVDGVNGLANTSGRLDILIEDSLIDQLTFFSPDPTHISDNATHNDAIQLASGSGLIVRGSVLAPYYALDVGNPTSPRTGGIGNPWKVSPYSGQWRGTSCLMLNNDAPGGPANEILIEDSWMTGAAVGVNALSSSVANVECIVRNNHLGLDWRLIDDKKLTYTVPNSYAVCGPSSNIEMSGNVLWVPGDPLNSDTPNNTRKLTNA